MNNKAMSTGRQHGFVLVLTLVMLVVLTLIGISSMNTASMELRSASNYKQHQVAFMAGYALMDYVISDDGVEEVDFQTKTPNPVTNPPAVNGVATMTADVSYDGCSVAPGSSLEAGKGFMYNYYSVNGRASNATQTAVSLQNQGVRYPAAGC